MDIYIKKIHESNIWKKIHSQEDVLSIMSYFKNNNVDYSSIDDFLNYLINNNHIDKSDINKKFFTSILMIAYFPDDVIGKNRGDKENLIYDRAKEIYEMVKNCKVENIQKKLITFKILFNEWKKQDKISQINLLCEMYYKYTESLEDFNNKKKLTDSELLDVNKDITETMDAEDKHNYIVKAREYDEHQASIFKKQIFNTQNKILHQLKILTPNYKKYLSSYKFKNVEYDESVYKMVYTKMKYIYWKNIKRDIFELKKKDIFNHIINDYIEIIANLKVKNLDYSEINRLSDYDIDEDNLLDACIELCIKIVEINKKIDSENYDEIYDMLIKKLDNNKKYITEIFKFCFDRLESIKKIMTGLSLKNNSQ